MYARYFPATFLSVITDDCIKRVAITIMEVKIQYNLHTVYRTRNCCRLSFGFQKHVFDDKTITTDQLMKAISVNFAGEEVLRQRIINNTPFFGNDDSKADDIAVKVYNDLFDLIDNRPNGKEGRKISYEYALLLAITTLEMLWEQLDGRLAGKAISDGTSPAHGADTHGPTAVIRSLGKLDQIKSGGILLNMRFLPGLLSSDESIAKLGSLIRSYFSLGGHHIQFNIVDNATLIEARKNPEEYRDLMVRVAGYSDYFNDLHDNLKQEIIDRTENEVF